MDSCGFGAGRWHRWLGGQRFDDFRLCGVRSARGGRGAPNELRAAIDSAEGVLRDSAVARAVIQEAGLDRPPYNFNPQTLGGEAITLGRDATGSAISIDVRLTEGNLAARTANALAAPATAPIRPMSPRVGRNIAVGIASGLILVVVAPSLGQMLRVD